MTMMTVSQRSHQEREGWSEVGRDGGGVGQDPRPVDRGAGVQKETLSDPAFPAGQFVPFRDYVDRTGNHVLSMARLARDVLAEIPEQLVSYMKAQGIRPRPPPEAPTSSPPQSPARTPPASPLHTHI